MTVLVWAKLFTLPGLGRKHRDFQTCIAREGLCCLRVGLGFLLLSTSFFLFFLHEVFSRLYEPGATVVKFVSGYLRREGSNWVAKISRVLFTTPCQCPYFIPTGQPSFEIEISSKKGVFGLHLRHCNMEGGGWDLGRRKKLNKYF